MRGCWKSPGSTYPDFVTIVHSYSTTRFQWQSASMVSFNARKRSVCGAARDDGRCATGVAAYERLAWNAYVGRSSEGWASVVVGDGETLLSEL